MTVPPGSPGGPARIVVTGTTWMGHGIGSVESAMRQLIEQARDRVDLLVYAISAFGATEQLDLLESAAARGVKLRLIVNRLAAQPDNARDRLIQIIGAYPWCTLWDFKPEDPHEDLHAKVLVVDRTTLLIGSTNLSDRGFLRNYEMGAVLEGAAAEEAARAIDVLLSDTHRLKRVTGAIRDPTLGP